MFLRPGAAGTTAATTPTLAERTGHAVVIELLKFRANPLGSVFEVPEKSHLVFVDLAVSE